MTINSFSIPSNKEILKDLNENSRTIKFINEGFLNQSLEKTVYNRNFMYRFDAEKKEYQIRYIKKGFKWELIEIVSVNTSISIYRKQVKLKNH